MPSLHELEHHDEFIQRHVGPNDAEIAEMLQHVCDLGVVRTEMPLDELAVVLKLVQGWHRLLAHDWTSD
jgi:hypothetical protein